VRAVLSVPRVILVVLGILVALGLGFVLAKRTSVLSAPGSPDSAQEAVSPGPATDGLACIQNALGGVRAFAGVSSLRILANTKPAEPARAANRREIGMVFPDRYKRHDVGTGRHEGLEVISGFNGNLLLRSPRPPAEIADAMMLSGRREFIQQVLRRLPRQVPGVSMSRRTGRDGAHERLAIDAEGAGGLATLLADPRTCMPIALEFMNGTLAYRIDLSEFRRFGGILFPTLLRTWRDGELWTDEYVSDVQVNAPIEAAFFRQ
jgi:hypothetical protein